MTSRTVIIGGGIIGVATAYYLAKRGCRVVLLEQGEIGGGCSLGNAGQITPGHLPLPQPGTLLRNLAWLLTPTSPLYVAPRLDLSLVRWLCRFQLACNRPHLRMATRVLCQLGEASARLYAELAREITISCDFRGRLEVCRSARTFQSACEEAELLRELGFSAQRLSGGEAREFEPAVRCDVAGAVYYPNSGCCNPHQLVLALAERARALGAEVRAHTKVTDLKVSSGRLTAVVTNQGDIPADAAVLSCGSWTPQLANRLGPRLPIQPGKGYHLDVDRPQHAPALPVVLVDERIFVTPLDDVLRLAGTMEFSGFNLKLRATRLEMLSVGAGRYFGEVDQSAVRSRWCHLRPMTPDGLPVIGRAPRASNVWIAAGHGMLGITQGPITGKLLAECITGEEPSIDLEPLRPDRFGGALRLGRRARI